MIVGDSYLQGAAVGSVDEPGLLVQEEVDQRRQTKQAVGSWGPTGDLLVIWSVGWGGLDWFGWVGLAQTRGKKKEAAIGLLVMNRKEGWVENWKANYQWEPEDGE